MMRHLFIIIDMSESMTGQDLKPTRSVPQLKTPKAATHSHHSSRYYSYRRHLRATSFATDSANTAAIATIHSSHPLSPP